MHLKKRGVERGKENFASSQFSSEYLGIPKELFEISVNLASSPPELVDFTSKQCGRSTYYFSGHN